jgi:predicted MFS family arabinose efflux permease
MGAFYPPLQAFIGDVSGPGRLAKNLGAFNVGWCVGSAVAAQIAARLLKLGFAQTFLCSAVFIVVAMLVLVLWKKPKDLTAAEVENIAPPKVIPGNDIWLLIGRFGHFTGFFGYAAIRIIFPELGKELLWTDPEKASITGFLLWGLGTGIFITGVSPWWRGKIWPQLAAHAGMAAAALGMGIFQDKVLLGASFLVFGTCMAICYTTAIYHGLAARSKMGRNMGIHEALVAAGQISGSIIGGIAANQLGLRSPYFILAGVAACAMISSAWLYTTKLKNIESLEATT